MPYAKRRRDAALNMAYAHVAEPSFAEVAASLRDKLIEQFCVEAGGPCVYTGDSMQESHKGLTLTPSDFNALVEDLQAAMTVEGVPIPTQNRLLARLAPMRSQVIDQ